MGIEKFKKWDNWVDHASNPVIKSEPPEWIIADPTFVPPDESPDGKWHLFAHVMLFGIYHYVSRDGLKWISVKERIESGLRPFLYKQDDDYYLFYEKLFTILRGVIVFRKSKDLISWTEPKMVLNPNLTWEREGSQRVGNPCLVKDDDKYRLYYSCGSVFLWDVMVPEPKYIGLAEANTIDGPYEKNADPIISPTKKHIYRNFGAGAIKVLKVGADWVGFNNGIYKDRFRRSRSSILLLHSTDGIDWKDVFKRPIIYPTKGWKKALIYQLDVRKVDQKYWLFYNARNGWILGREQIGLATLDLK